MKKSTRSFRVRGMVCASCEKAVEKALRGLPGVSAVMASFAEGRLEVEFERESVSEADIGRRVREAGYELGGSAADGRQSGLLGIAIGISAAAAFLVIDAVGGFALLPNIDSSFSLGMLCFAGILTSFHCVAMCGGIALSQSLPAAADAGSGAGGFAGKIRPGLLYNGGRVLSYTMIGGAAGALGGAFGFSSTAKSVITGAAGVFMLFLGLRMLGLFRRFPLPRSLPLPGFLRAAAAKLSGRGAFAVGLLNGFMPCGPLQTMQIYALGTGSASMGALSMFLFSLGTTPLLLGFGAAASLISKRTSFQLVRAGAVLVIFLGALTLGRAFTLWGFAPIPELASAPPQSRLARGGNEPAGLIKALRQGDIQTVMTEIEPSRYKPFIVRKGVPVRWTIRAAAGNLNGCNNAVVVPELGLKVRLRPGDNLVEFTPAKAGTISYSCWMGMIRSKIIVTEEENI